MTAGECRPGAPDEHGRPAGAPPVCTGAGNMLSCQLCPSSPTFWRNTPYPPAPNDATGLLEAGDTGQKRQAEGGGEMADRAGAEMAADDLLTLDLLAGE